MPARPRGHPLASAFGSCLLGAPQGASCGLVVSGFTEALPGNATVVANQPGMFHPVRAREVAETDPGPTRTGLRRTGRFDAASAKDGGFSATVGNSPKPIGETAVKNMVALLGGEDGGGITDIPLTLITEEYVDEAPECCPA